MLCSLCPVAEVLPLSDALSHEVSQDTDRVIGGHTPRVVRGKWPTGQDSPLIIVTDEATTIAQGSVGINDREQWM